jgi:hypothetical protein
MALFVQVINGEVKQVWDSTPPAGEAGWVDAVEVRAPIQSGRQGYTAHRFDLTTTPVQIIWDTYDITVEQRRADMSANAGFVFQQVLQEQARNPESYSAEQVEEARLAMVAKQDAIAAATTHDELDALV